MLLTMVMETTLIMTGQEQSSILISWSLIQTAAKIVFVEVQRLVLKKSSTLENQLKL